MEKISFVGNHGETIAVNRRYRKIAKSLNGRKLRNRDEMLDFILTSCEEEGIDPERMLKTNGVNTTGEFFTMLYTILAAKRSGLLFDRG